MKPMINIITFTCKIINHYYKKFWLKHVEQFICQILNLYYFDNYSQLKRKYLEKEIQI